MTLDPDRRLAAMQRTFLSLYGAGPTLGTRAPGRVDLMGSHTDYNEGCVLTLPVDRETWILARPRADGRVRAASMNLRDWVTLSAEAPEREPVEGWGRYLQGVAVEISRAGYPVPGCDALVFGTIPLGSGLSSSASLEAAFATLLEALGGYQLDPLDKARLTQRAENRWVGVNCGILDQYSVILGERGRALLLDCRTLTHEGADFPPGLQVVVCDTKAPRELTGSEYGERRTQCETGAAFFAERASGVRSLRDVSPSLFRRHAAELSDKVTLRARFIIEEQARVLAMADALRRDDRASMSVLCAASFAGARDLFEICVPAMEAMVETMREGPGCVACRQAGGGFGGCMVAFVERETVDAFCRSVQETYARKTGRTPEVYPVLPVAGAGSLAGVLENSGASR